MRLLGLFGIALIILAAPVWADPPALAPAQFEKLQSLIRPANEDAAWMQIPWNSSLWAARQQAAREGKPILLWEMDGHPLGCV